MSRPLHITISETLRQQITTGHYRPGEQLPSEHQLMAEFGVSRITVRRVIANLTHQGLVTTHQGKGAFVTQSQKVTYSLSSPLVFLDDDLARQGIQLSMQNLSYSLVPAPKTVRDCLHLREDNPTAYLQKKLLLLNGVAGGVDITYVLPELGAELAAELQCQMTFPTLEQHGIPITRIEAILECTHADAEIADYLDVPLGHPLIVYGYTAYACYTSWQASIDTVALARSQPPRLADSHLPADTDPPFHDHRPIVPVLHGQSISRGDRFSYAITLKK